MRSAARYWAARKKRSFAAFSQGEVEFLQSTVPGEFPGKYFFRPVNSVLTALSPKIGRAQEEGGLPFVFIWGRFVSRPCFSRRAYAIGRPRFRSGRGAVRCGSDTAGRSRCCGRTDGPFQMIRRSRTVDLPENQIFKNSLIHPACSPNTHSAIAPLFSQGASTWNTFDPVSITHIRSAKAKARSMSWVESSSALPLS